MNSKIQDLKIGESMKVKFLDSVDRKNEVED